MKYRKILACLFSIVLLGGLLLAGGIPVSADDGQPARADTVMTLQQKTQTDRSGTEYLVLTAKLTQADGYPLSERYINFYEDINVLGEGLLAIGTAQTSAAGIATLRYETQMLGEHNVSAIYPGDAISLSAGIRQVYADGAAQRRLRARADRYGNNKQCRAHGHRRRSSYRHRATSRGCPGHSQGNCREP